MWQRRASQRSDVSSRKPPMTRLTLPLRPPPRRAGLRCSRDSPAGTSKSAAISAVVDSGCERVGPTWFCECSWSAGFAAQRQIVHLRGKTTARSARIWSRELAEPRVAIAGSRFISFSGTSGCLLITSLREQSAMSHHNSGVLVRACRLVHAIVFGPQAKKMS